MVGNKQLNLYLSVNMELAVSLTNFAVREMQIQIKSFFAKLHVTLAKFLRAAEPQFPHLYNRSDNTSLMAGCENWIKYCG